MTLKAITNKQPPKGYRWVFCRYRKVRGESQRKLDAHEYGWQSWAFLVRESKG
ncbi:hypothetical protein [Pantoea agglomerans]|uniref:hypothetical protein n=1 Tax=Enterobacter agglomerans TaxID=549 RepID=UPI00301D5634